jgi:AsmA protein
VRLVRYIALGIGGLIAVLVLALLAAWLLVDPNDYKERIAAAVKSSTGRELAMPGAIELSLFPWLALQIGPASLGNPAGFGAEPFAVVQRAALRVKLLPLLRGQVQVGRIEIDGLDLRLAKNAAGKGNWEDFANESGPATPTGKKQPLDLAGIVIRNSRIGYDDVVVQNLGLDVGRVETGKPIAVKLALDLIDEKGAQPLPVAGAFDASLDAAAERFHLTSLRLDGKLPAQSGKSAVPWQFAAPDLNLDTAAQTLTAAHFDARLASAQVAGRLAGTKIIDAPELRGEFTLQPVALRQLLQELGIAAPVTRDAQVLGKLSAQGAFGYAGDEASAHDLALRLDDSTVTGGFSMRLGTSAMNFDIAIDRIDLDRYLPPPQAPAAQVAKKAPFELPTDALAPLLARGRVAIRQAKIAGVALADLSVAVDAKDRVTRIAPAKAQLYGGQYSGDITIDSRASEPTLKIEQTMTGIDVARLLDDFAATRRLSGKGNVTTSLIARGRNSDALMKSLTGKASVNLVDGAVEGADVWYAIAQAQSLLSQRTLASVANRKRTPFDSFKVSADIAAGVATSRDLNIASQQLRVTGQGSANLVTQALDYRVIATVLKAPPGAGGAEVPTLAAIPVNITGSFDDPKLRPDLAGIAKAKVKEELDKHKEELQQKLQDKLKGLFGR